MSNFHRQQQRIKTARAINRAANLPAVRVLPRQGVSLQPFGAIAVLEEDLGPPDLTKKLWDDDFPGLPTARAKLHLPYYDDSAGVKKVKWHAAKDELETIVVHNMTDNFYLEGEGVEVSQHYGAWLVTGPDQEYADMGIVKAGGSPAADFTGIGNLGTGPLKKLLDEENVSGELIQFTRSNQWVYVLKQDPEDETKWGWRPLPQPQPVINPTPYMHSGGIMLWVSRVGNVWVVRRPVLWPTIYRVQCIGSLGDGVPVTFENRAPFNSQVANIAQINTGAFPGNTQGTTIQINCPCTQWYRVSFE